MAQGKQTKRSDQELTNLKRKAKEVLEETRRSDQVHKRHEVDNVIGKRRESAGKLADALAQRSGVPQTLPPPEDSDEKNGGRVPISAKRRENQLQQLLSKNLSCCNVFC